MTRPQLTFDEIEKLLKLADNPHLIRFGFQDGIEIVRKGVDIEADLLKSLCTELLQLREWKREAGEVIHFYGNPNNWQKPSNQFSLEEDDYDLADMIDDDHESFSDVYKSTRGGSGGKRARQFLEKYKEK